jgi:ferredoxin
MKIDAVRLIYFSPTRTTKTTLMAIAEGLGAERVEHLDLTTADAESREFEKVDNTLVIIGTPVYGGRVPLIALQRLQALQARGTPAGIVVVYGNRAYEDALLELKHLVAEAGFIPVAAAACIGEHSLASETTPLAIGRPDSQDLGKAKEFGRAIREKVEGIGTLAAAPPVEVPGNFPYKERGERRNVSPVTRKASCVSCGKCVALCPMGAITMEDSAVSDPNACIRCCACVKDCPEGARVLEDPASRELAEKLSMNCKARKEPEVFL